MLKNRHIGCTQNVKCKILFFTLIGLEILANQRLVWNFVGTRDLSGIGTFKNSQIGAHPSFKFHTSKFSLGTYSLIILLETRNFRKFKKKFAKIDCKYLYFSVMLRVKFLYKNWRHFVDITKWALTKREIKQRRLFIFNSF